MKKLIWNKGYEDNGSYKTQEEWIKWFKEHPERGRLPTALELFKSWLDGKQKGYGWILSSDMKDGRPVGLGVSDGVIVIVNFSNNGRARGVKEE